MDRRPLIENLTSEEILKLIGNQGEQAYVEMAEQFPKIFEGISSASFIAVYNAAFLTGFRSAETIYRANLLQAALDPEATSSEE